MAVKECVDGLDLKRRVLAETEKMVVRYDIKVARQDIGETLNTDYDVVLQRRLSGTDKDITNVTSNLELLKGTCEVVRNSIETQNFERIMRLTLGVPILLVIFAGTRSYTNNGPTAVDEWPSLN